jgi:hypothetical protein
VVRRWQEEQEAGAAFQGQLEVRGGRCGWSPCTLSFLSRTMFRPSASMNTIYGESAQAGHAELARLKAQAPAVKTIGNETNAHE